MSSAGQREWILFITHQETVQLYLYDEVNNAYALGNSIASSPVKELEWIHVVATYSGAAAGTSTNFTVQALNGNFTFEFEEGVLMNNP